MPKVAGSVKELLVALDGIVRIEGDRLVVVDEGGLRTRGIYDLAWTATFSEDETTVEAARWIIWEASQAVGCPSASIQELYKARARGEYEAMTVPAINLRAQTFDMARVILETAKKNDSAAVIFELAPSRPIPTSASSSTRPASLPAPSPPAGRAPSSSRVTTTNSTPRSTRPTPRR
jgi:hypothetical protein